MRCRTCKWLDVKLDSRGRRVPRKNQAYECTVPVPMPVLPASTMPIRVWPPPRYWMEPDDGADCPTHELVEELKS